MKEEIEVQDPAPIIIPEQITTEINKFLEATNSILEKGLMNLFIKFIIGNIKS